MANQNNYDNDRRKQEEQQGGKQGQQGSKTDQNRQPGESDRDEHRNR